MNDDMLVSAVENMLHAHVVDGILTKDNYKDCTTRGKLVCEFVRSNSEYKINRTKVINAFNNFCDKEFEINENNSESTNSSESTSNDEPTVINNNSDKPVHKSIDKLVEESTVERPRRKRVCASTEQSTNEAEEILNKLKENNVNVVHVSNEDIENIIKDIEKQVEELDANDGVKKAALVKSISEYIQKGYFNKSKVETLINNILCKVDESKFKQYSKVSNKFEDSLFSDWCEQMYVIKQLDEDMLTNKDEQGELNKLHQVYKIMNNSEIEFEEFKDKLSQWFEYEFPCGNHLNGKLFVECLKQKYPTVNFDKFSEYHEQLDNYDLISADNWSQGGVVKVGNVGIGEWDCISTGSDHYFWHPVMESNEEWKYEDVGSNIFLFNRIYNEFDESNKISFIHQLRDLTRGYDEILTNIKQSTSVDEFMYWFNEMKERIDINNDSNCVEFMLYRIGGFVFETKEECEHIIDLMSFTYRIVYDEEENNNKRKTGSSIDDKQRNIKQVSESEYNNIKTVYIFDDRFYKYYGNKSKSTRKSPYELDIPDYVEYKDDTITNTVEEGEFIIRDETPDDWKYFASASIPWYTKREQSRRRYCDSSDDSSDDEDENTKRDDYYNVDNETEYPTIEYSLSGINLINIEIIYKYVQLTGTKRIPDWLWLQFDPYEYSNH